MYLTEDHRLARRSMAARRSLPSFWEERRERKKDEMRGEKEVAFVDKITKYNKIIQNKII